MFLKAVASIILCASLFLGSFPIGAYPFTDRKGVFKPASYEGYEITLVDGETIGMHIVGSSIAFDSSVDRKYNITIYKAESMRTVKNFPGAGRSFSVDVGSAIKEDILYYVVISYEAYGLTVLSSWHLNAV